MLKSFGLQEKYLSKNIMAIPSFMAKMPVFTACSKNKNRTSEYRKIKIESYFGYKNVVIKGETLNASLDFKVFSGLMKVRDNAVDNADEISISLLDFCELIGYDRSKVGTTTKKAINQSFEKFISQSTSFVNNEDDVSFASIINNIEINGKIITITYNKKLKYLYKKDRYVFYYDINYFNKIKTETAKCLWLMMETNSKFQKFKKLDVLKRLNLKQEKTKEINRLISKSLDELVKINYLTSFEIDKDYITVRKNFLNLT